MHEELPDNTERSMNLFLEYLTELFLPYTTQQRKIPKISGHVGQVLAVFLELDSLLAGSLSDPVAFGVLSDQEILISWLIRKSLSTNSSCR